MRKETLNIRRWLAAIVLLLMVPILLFATLWLRQTLNSLDAIDRSLAGLSAISDLEPALRRIALSDDTRDIPSQLDADGLLPLAPDTRSMVNELYAKLVDSDTIHSAMAEARTVSRLISRSVDLPTTVSLDSGELPDVVADTLLTVVLESSAMVTTGERIAMKDEVNLWDKMAVTVQGGQFKVAADQVARISREFFPTVQTPSAEGLQSLAEAYRKANGTYQSAGAQLLTSTLQAMTGAELTVEPVGSEFPKLAAASLDLWRGALDHMVEDLDGLHKAKTAEIAIAGNLGLLVIVCALGLAIYLSRQLVERADKKFDNLGLIDKLTGLGNRQALIQTVQAARCASGTGMSGVLHLDVRRFRGINTRYGEDIGDEVLRTVARLLSELTLKTDTLVRAGGAEFILFRPHLSRSETLETLADRITHCLATERMIRGHLIRLDCCIGLSLSQASGAICEQLLTDASLALRNAKQKGSFSVCLFAPQMRLTFERSNEIAKDLNKALEKRQITPWYQPQICARTGRIVGAEALVRWIDDKGEVRTPIHFLPAAEEAGYMERIDGTVREQALGTASRLAQKSPFAFHIGLNVSASVLSEPDCVERLVKETKAAGLTPAQVSIEILEAVMLDAFDAKPIMQNVSDLSGLGFFIELDDFGTGHASIASLRDLKIDRVKIDRSFIAGVDRDTDLQTFTRALIQLARSLNIAVLAEGVETVGEQEWLTENGCDILQGYFFSKPVSADKIFDLVALQPFSRPQLVEPHRPAAKASQG